MPQEITPTTTPDKLPEYSTVEETAAYFRLTTWTVYSLIRKGKIPHRRIGKTIFIPKAFFLLAEQTTATAVAQ